MKTLAQWLSFIEQLHPQTIALGLERVACLAEQLNLTVFNCPVITVAGTNGKGSCVRLLESFLVASGYQVGAYTSPHLLTFNERIRVGNQQIDDQTLCAAFAIIEAARTVPLTFFEFTTLAALWIFKHTPLDVLILEVGLGGRLDAVNIVDPDIAIVTSIDLDHLDWLGDSREAIGYEKAGIFRPNQVVICGDPHPPHTLLQHARLLSTDWYCVGSAFDYVVENNTWSWHCNELALHDMPLPILAIRNAATALMALAKLRRQLPWPLALANSVMSQTHLPGRLQQISSPPCILDVAHNPAAAKLLAEQVRALSKQKLIAVVGMLADKDVANTLQPLKPLVKEWHVGTLSIARGGNAKDIAMHLQDFAQARWYTYASIAEAFQAALNALAPQDKILAFGSFYTIAGILNLLEKRGGCDNSI